MNIIVDMNHSKITFNKKLVGTKIMAWPKKHTRRIKVDDEVFLWHLSGNDLEGKEKSITIGKEDERFFLLLDPYAWDTLVEPAIIHEVIDWAIEQGWTAEKGPTRSLAYLRETETYIWLPDGIRHIYQIDS
ncbi:MAG: hypothetical protein GY854_25065 [Deltaproteobacteria bacterium]|nr:hypothetical protein [Deltaproteobacteria bacterium]